MSISLTQKQIPNESILDHFGRQQYLGNRYVAALASGTIATGGAETVKILLKNAAASGITMFIDILSMAALTVGHSAVFKFYLNPTSSANGTAMTIKNLKTGSANTAVGTAFTGPTVSVNGTLLATIGSVTPTPGQAPFVIGLDPGDNLLMTVTVSNDGDAVGGEVSWYEL